MRPFYSRFIKYFVPELVVLEDRIALGEVFGLSSLTMFGQGIGLSDITNKLNSDCSDLSLLNSTKS